MKTTKKQEITFFSWRSWKAAMFFLVVLVLLSSCRKPENEIGLELQSDEELIGLQYTDTFAVEAFTIDEDSLRSDELSLSLAGNYVDPVLGAVSAGFYTHVRLSTNNVDFGSSKYVVVDSMVLSLVYEGNYYGNLTPQEWEVFEVAEDLFIDSIYHTTTQTSFLPQNLVKPGYGFQPILPGEYIQTGTDSLIPQLRLRLREELGERFAQLSSSSELANNNNFISYFKGLYVRSATPDAGVIRFDLLNPSSKVTMYYRDLQNGDTLLFDFNINSDCARYNQYSFDYTGTDYASVSENPVAGEAFCAVQAGAGLKTRITIPGIKTLNTSKTRTINKAELILPVREDLQADFSAQSQLFVLTTNEEGETVSTPDQFEGPSHIGGLYSASSKEYRFNITRFIQEVINGTAASDTLYIVSNNSGVSVNRVILAGTNYGVEEETNIRLRLFWSE
jgi:hypothetical protein